jgi:hypothetical protein
MPPLRRPFDSDTVLASDDWDKRGKPNHPGGTNILFFNGQVVFDPKLNALDLQSKGSAGTRLEMLEN